MSQPWYVAAYDERYFQTYADEFTAEQTQAETDGALSLLNLSPPARVLDLCCGFGRHSVEMARRGFPVTGLDLSPALLGHARAAADNAGVSVDWVQADMRHIPVPAAPYDAVLCLFSSWGVFDTVRDEQQVALSVAHALAPGGQVLVDTVNREVMLRHWMPRRWRERPDGTLLLDKLRFDARTGILHSEERVVALDGSRRTDTHQLRLWAASELSYVLETAGLAVTGVYGGLDGSPYTRDAHRLVVAARKPR